MTMHRQAPGSFKPLATLPFLSLLTLILTTLLALPPILARAESPAAAKFVTPGEMNTGALLLQTEGGLVEAPRLETDVVVTVNGTIARTVVTQHFTNPGDTWLEGIYVFPLPEQSAVDGLRMEIGDRVIVGEIKGRDEAKELYEAAKDAGQKASLVEQERPNIFTNSVANIGPHESVIIRIEYQETVKQDGGVYSLRFPLVVAPRYNPEPKIVNLVDYGGKIAPVDPVPDRDRITPPVLDPAEHGKINPVSIQVTLNAGFALGDIDSAYHEIALKRTGDETAVLALADGTVPADKDFELTWRPKAALAPQTALFHEVVDGEHYLFAMVTPPTLDADPKILPRELIFVIDNSGSMSGTSIVQAKQSLLFALDRLRPEDTFNVIRFDDTLELLFDAAVPANSENLAIAKHFVSRLDAEGGTEMLPALKAALKDTNPDDDASVRQVVFLTDGAIGNEAQLFAEISANAGRSRLFTVGIGSAPNSYFMRRAAELGRGTFTHIGAEAQVLERMSALFAKLEKPLLVGLKAEWPAGTTTEVWPDPLPDLYAGEPVVLSAKVSSPDGELRLKGTFDGKPWSVAIPLADAVDGAGVGKLWARTKIAALEAKQVSDGDQGIAKSIEKVALLHHLVSSQTSLVAIDPATSRPDGENVTSTELPLNLPDGWVYDKVFGRSIAGKQLRAALPLKQVLAFDQAAAPSAASTLADVAATPAEEAPAPQPVAASYDTADAATETEMPQSPATGVTAPQETSIDEISATPTPNSQTRQIGMFILLLTILSAVTLLLWRHYRRDDASPRRIGRRI
ncbi:MAG: marine proteobacterial sortase target protein [Hyphomicrobiales bacterium]